MEEEGPKLTPEPGAPPGAGGAEDDSADGVLKCPFCGSPLCELISLFGTQAIFAQYRCLACGTPFEALKY